MEEMLLIENKKGMKVYAIKNKYLCECGVLNEKNVCNACMKYMKRKNVGGLENERLLNCIRNGIYVMCSMYDELKSLEDEKKVK